MESYKNKYVIITTDKRNVFAGELVSAERTSPTTHSVTLKNARMILSWSRDTHGILGLATNGATPGCRISPAAPTVVAEGVHGMIEVTDVARKSIEEEPWA